MGNINICLRMDEGKCEALRREAMKHGMSVQQYILYILDDKVDDKITRIEKNVQELREESYMNNMALSVSFEYIKACMDRIYKNVYTLLTRTVENNFTPEEIKSILKRVADEQKKIKKDAVEKVASGEDVFFFNELNKLMPDDENTDEVSDNEEEDSDDKEEIKAVKFGGDTDDEQ